MKTRKIYAAFVILAMLISLIFSGCMFSDPEIKISVDGKEFVLGCKVQDLLDSGFDIALTNYEKDILTEEEYPVIGSKKMDQTNYYLISEGGLPCDLLFRVYNNDPTDLPLNECRVFLFKYDAGTYADYVPLNIEYPEVLLNGISFKFTDCKETVDALSDAGFKFNKFDAEKFTANDKYGMTVISPGLLFEHNMAIFHDYDNNDGVVRMNGFEISDKIENELK